MTPRERRVVLGAFVGVEDDSDLVDALRDLDDAGFAITRKAKS